MLELIALVSLLSVDTSSQFQTVAAKVVAGEIRADPWQIQAYKSGLAKGVTEKTFVVTTYSPEDGGGRIDRHGKRCTLRTCASNKIRQYHYIWIERVGVRQVLDTGARSNDKKGGIWVDIWYPNRREAKKLKAGFTKMSGVTWR